MPFVFSQFMTAAATIVVALAILSATGGCRQITRSAEESCISSLEAAMLDERISAPDSRSPSDDSYSEWSRRVATSKGGLDCRHWNEGELRDSWGNRYQFLDRGEGRFIAVVSSGPDGALGTPDDIKRGSRLR